MTKRSDDNPAIEPKRGRGRPGLGDAEMLMVRVPGGMLARIDEAAGGPGKRAAWVRATIDREIERRSRGR